MCRPRRDRWSQFERDMRAAGRRLERGMRRASEEVAAAGRVFEAEMASMDESSFDWAWSWSDARARRRARRAERRAERRARRAERWAARRARLGPFAIVACYWWLVFPLYYGLRPLWDGIGGGAGVVDGVGAMVQGVMNLSPAGPFARFLADGLGLSFADATMMLALAAATAGAAAWIGLRLGGAVGRPVSRES